MRNLIKTMLVLAAFLAVLPEKSYATVINSQFIADKVKESLIKQYSSTIHGRISVEVRQIPFKTLEIPDGHITIKTTINSNFFSPMTVAKVNILVNGQQEQTFGIPVKITVQDEVWVAIDNITKGETLTGNNITVEKKDISLIANNAARHTYDPLNSIAKKNYKIGDVIDTRFIETAPTVRKNTSVSIIFQSNNITIVADGKALEDGKIGDFVKVKNEKYNMFYTGKVVSVNTILVNI